MISSIFQDSFDFSWIFLILHDFFDFERLLRFPTTSSIFHDFLGVFLHAHRFSTKFPSKFSWFCVDTLIWSKDFLLLSFYTAHVINKIHGQLNLPWLRREHAFCLVNTLWCLLLGNGISYVFAAIVVVVVVFVVVVVDIFVFVVVVIPFMAIVVFVAILPYWITPAANSY